MRTRITPQRQMAADLRAENDRQCWLLRNGHRAFGPSDRRVGSGERAQTSAARRPSDRARGRGRDSENAGHPSSLLGVLGLIAMFAVGAWLAVAGSVWIAFELLRWVSRIFGWG